MQKATEPNARLRPLRLALKALATTLVLVFLIYTLDLPALWRLVKGSDPSLLLVAVGITLLVNLIKPLRWLILLRALAPETSYQTALRSHLVSTGARLVLPGKLGEFGRAVGLPNIDLRRGLYLAGLDTLFEVIITSALAIPGFYLLFGWLGALALAVPWTALVVSVLRGSAADAELATQPVQGASWRQRVNAALRAAVNGIRVVGGSRLRVGLCITVGIASLRLAQLALLVVALRSAVNLKFAALYPVIQLADAFPFTLGGIGVREWVGIVVLPLAELSVETAAAAILMQYLITNLLPGLIGWGVLLTATDRQTTKRPSWLS